MLRKISYILSYISAGITGVSAFSTIIICIMSIVAVASSGQAEAGFLIGTLIGQLIGVGILVLCTWFGVFYANKVKNAKSKKEVKTLSIVALFVLGILPGLFCLISEDSEYETKTYTTSKDETIINQTANDLLKNNNPGDDPVEKLKKLSELHDKKLISEEEYNEARKNIIDKL